MRSVQTIVRLIAVCFVGLALSWLTSGNAMAVPPPPKAASAAPAPVPPTPAATAAAAAIVAPPDEADVGAACLVAYETKGVARTALLTNAEIERAKVLKADGTGPKWPTCAAAAKDLCGRAARHEIPNSSKVLAHLPACLKINSGLTAGVASIGADLVQSIAQVVVTKAQAAGWGLLLQKIEEVAHCDATDTSFPRACKVVQSLSIKDLVSSPAVLLNAVIADLMAQIRDPVAKEVIQVAAPVLGAGVLDATVRWSQSGAAGIVQAMRQAILDEFVKDAKASCAGTITEKYGYVAAICLAQYPLAEVSKCGASEYIDECAAPATDDNAELHRLWDLTTSAFPLAPLQPKAADALNLAFAVGKDQLDVWLATLPASDPNKQRALDYFAGTQDLLTGLAGNDWVKATSGGVRIVTTLEMSLGADRDTCDEKSPDAATAAACTAAKAVDPASCDPTKPACKTSKRQRALKDGAKLLQFLAAVGNYALTYDPGTNKDPAAAAAAREKIITELVDRFVNRTDRRSGTVVSLGGNLGLIAGARFASTDKLRGDLAFPVQLTLGVGLQTYGEKTGGFHAMLSVIDLGQYVNMNNSGALQVGTPDLSSAVGFGLTLGGWCSLRETPFYIGAHSSVAPFNQASGNPTFQLGLVTGIYVPLLDFN